MLGTLHLTKTEEARPAHTAWLPLFAACAMAAVLIWGVTALPPFGAADNPIHVLGPDYLARSIEETGVANVVTSVLSSYRGFDTLGETTVIFTAGIAVLLLLKRSPRRRGMRR
jgi:multicomponent Na+:H+ antiporter subunit B